MGEQITIEVSERVVRHAADMAARSRRRVEEVLSEWLEQVVSEMPVEDLPDDEVLRLTELRLSPKQQESLSDLLARNREGTLNARDRQGLDAMMHTYERGLLRKAQALRVAVQRGLRQPLDP